MRMPSKRMPAPAPGIASGLPVDEALLVLGEYTRINGDAVGLAELSIDLKAALDRIPERLALAVERRFFEDMSFKEIGLLTGVGPQRGRDLVLRGLRILRRRSHLNKYLALYRSCRGCGRKMLFDDENVCGPCRQQEENRRRAREFNLRSEYNFRCRLRREGYTDEQISRYMEWKNYTPGCSLENDWGMKSAK